MKYVSSILVLIMCFGCSGKVQTNPIPSQNKIFLPHNKEKNINVSINNQIKNNFDDYAKLILSDINADESTINNFYKNEAIDKNYEKVTNPSIYSPKTIWQTGLDISKRYQKDKK